MSNASWFCHNYPMQMCKKKICTVKVYFDNIYIGHILPNIALKPHAVLRINDLINSFR